MTRRSTSRHRSRSRSLKRDYRRRTPVSPRRNRSHSADRNSKSDVERLDPLPSKVLGVFGLSPSTDEAALRQIFSRFGRITSIHIVYDRGTGRSRGFGFIYFEKIEDAKEARKETQGMKIDGGTVRVAFSLTDKPHEPTPGVYMGTPVSQYIRNDRKNSRRHRSRSRTPRRYRSRSRSPRRHRSRSRTPRRYRSRSRTPRRYRSPSRSPRRRSRS